MPPKWWSIPGTRKPLLYLVLLLASPLAGFGQMVPPQDWKNYEKVFGVTNGLRHYDYEADAITSSIPAGILWPGEQPAFTIRLVNTSGAPLKTAGKIVIIRYGTRGRPGDVWLPDMVKLDELDPIPVSVDIPAGSQKELVVHPVIPALFGGYALVIDLGPHGRRLVTSFVRTFAANPQRLQFPKQSLDDMGAGFLQRIGVQAIRMGVDYTPTTAPDYTRKMVELDQKLAEYRAKNVTVLLMFGAGTAPMPLGMSRPFLDSNGVMRKTKQDYAWLPSSDPDFKAFVKRLCVKWGWPNGPVTAVSLWNEPWEGMSISGWQADIPRYREIYRVMADAVLEARSGGAEVLIGGGDSNSNAWDKLFADGKMTFLPIFDFCSIHYQGMESPALYPEWINRRSPYGRVRIWDTESWVGNTDDRIGLVVATNRSAGYDRSMGIYAGYMYTTNPAGGHPAEHPDTMGPTGDRRLPIPDTWSPTAAVGAVQHFIGERDFKELLFKSGLPWVMRFDGYNGDPDDGTAVVCGDIGEVFGADRVLYRGVKLKNGSMTLAADTAFRLYDFYGNQVASKDGRIVVPLNSQGYYLRAAGKGGFNRLVAALRVARIDGYSPVEIIAKDMTAPVTDHAVLRLQLTNILNRPVEGRLQVTLGDLMVTAPPTVSLRPHEVLTVPVKITGGAPTANNSYHLSARFDAGADGSSTHAEDMHVNLISRLHITVDGHLDDWRGALPQLVSSKDSGTVSLTEAAWYPFRQFDTHAGGLASGYFAYDDSNFYFAAKVADSTPHPGTYRFAERPDDEFFYPDTAWAPDRQRSLVTKESSAGGESYWESGDNTNSFGIDVQLPQDRFTQVAFWLPNIKVAGLSMDVLDTAGRLLLSRRVDNLWNGAYAVFDLSGKVRVVFHSFGWWYTAKVGAIFFDEARSAAGTPPGAARREVTRPGDPDATFVIADFDTKRNWRGVYGSLGYYLVGGGASLPGRDSLPAGPHLPAGITIQPVHHEVRTPLVWPAGVRHFTYRKNPVTPDNSGLGYGFDNVLLAFNVLPVGQDGMLANPPGTMPRYTGYKCTDYEYALNPVAPQYGGGTEIWRLLAPGLNRKHFFPRQPRSAGEGPVNNGRLVIRREGNTLITECAIPWSELPDVKKAMDEGRMIKLSFRVNDNGAPGSCMELAKDRSVSKVNARAFHPDWKTHWANEVEFAFERAPAILRENRSVQTGGRESNQRATVQRQTAAFQRQIDSCSQQGGGVVRVPKGKFRIGTLYLKDNVELHLEAGAILLGSTRPEDYPSNNGRPALLFAEKARHISVTGSGVIDGQGGDPMFQKGDNGEGRPRLIHFVHCRDVRVSGIALRNAPFWVQYYSGCDSVDIRDIKVYSHCNWNNDGLDIDGRDVTVSGVTIDTDDDALCLKSETPGRACENVRVTHCRLASNCNAIKLGTASKTGFRHITVSDCTVGAASEDNIRHWRQKLGNITAGRTALAGIAIETVDGGSSEDIDISDIRMDHVQTPIFIRLGDRQRRPVSCSAPAMSSLKDISISHIRATACSRISSSVTGLPGAPVRNVYLDDIRITGPGGGMATDTKTPVPEKAGSYPENRMFGDCLPASGFYFRHVAGLSLQHLQLRTMHPDARPVLVNHDVREMVGLPAARFSTGDNPAWKAAAFDDRGWTVIRSGIPWEQQGYAGYNGYAWYRFHFRLSSSLLQVGANGEPSTVSAPDSVSIDMGKIDDADEIWLNGVRLGKTGSFPADSEGYITKSYIKRKYRLPRHAALFRWDAENVIAVRVYDGSGNGGIYPNVPFIAVTGPSGCPDGPSGVSALAETEAAPVYDSSCILTPLPSRVPQINGADVFGVRPGSPFLFRIAATGARPMRYAVRNLPPGLHVDSTTGIITGTIEKEGEYQLQLVVTNAAGKALKGFTVKAGRLLSLTPPMGWNSWNCWGLTVDDAKVRDAARALIAKGLADHGWNYINIDDGWQAKNRSAAGEILPNDKFPDMKTLADWLHGNGLRFGIYSSPGPQTCGRFTGSYDHEQQDAATYARWGVDYLKYDWCTYGAITGGDTTLEAYIKPYRTMDRALRAQKRDILYSLCQYGMKEVWKWGAGVGASCWRTTGDITDSWSSILATGFSEAALYPYAGPGHWNDPDMLVLGNIGWGDLHPTRLTPDEQYAHMSLWCLLSAPLLIGADIGGIDDFTLGLLTNDEVLALDQDALGLQARRLVDSGGLQVWIKELEDGSRAIGLFNTDDTARNARVCWDRLGLAQGQHVRDCWRQKELGTFATGFSTELPPHGVRLIRITPVHNTLVPVRQNRDPLYNWSSRHAAILALNKTAPPANVILGNSIVHYWGGLPGGPFSNGGDSWQQWLEPLGVRNMGFGWDRIENVLWRVTHGELDGFTARHILILIGTNNLPVNTDEEIVAGLANLVATVRQRQPDAQILLSGLLPRRKMEARIVQLNAKIAVATTTMATTATAGVTYIDPGKLLLRADRSIDETLFVDGLHPNAAGYARLAPAIAGWLKE